MYDTWIHPLQHSLSSFPPPIPRLVSTDIIFPFTYMCTQYLYRIHPSSPFPHLLPSPTSTNHHTGRICSTLLFSDFCIRKKEAWHQWLMPVILASQEAEIRRITLWSQPKQIVHEAQCQKNPSQKRPGGIAQGEGAEFKPQHCKKNRREK
jgi:hypothetical protein